MNTLGRSTQGCIQRYTIGSLVVAVTGEKQYLDLFSKELEYTDSISEPDIIIQFSNTFDDYSPTHYCGKNTIDFNETSYSVNGNPYFSYHTSNPFSKGPIISTVKVKQPSIVHRVLRFLKIASSVEYGSAISFLRGELANYSYLWTLITLGLLKKETAFIHAGVLNHDGKSIVLSGTGGCGKTSTVLNLLQKPNVDYLAEDFGIVADDGLAYPSSKTISIYHSDVVRSKGVGQGVVSRLAWLQRLRWEVLTKLLKRNPIIKVSPEDLVDKPISPIPVQIEYGVYLSRQSVKSVSLREIALSEFAKRSAMASVRELKGLSEILKLIQANTPLSYNFISDEMLVKRFEDIYLQAFANVSVYMAVVPYEAGPDSVIDALYGSLNFENNA